MEQKQSVVTVNVSCVAGDNNVINDNDNKKQTIRRRKRGHNWSHKKRKKKGQNFLCYAVFAPIEKKGIFWKWIECEKQVKHCSNPVYKGFHSKVAAVDWLRGQEHKARLKLLLQQRALAKAKMPSATATVISNENAMDVSAHSAAASEPPIPFATAVPVPTPTAVPVNSTKTCRERGDGLLVRGRDG